MNSSVAIPNVSDFREYCRERTRRSGSNFYYSFVLLPKEKREAIFATYAFCRELDDIVDGDLPVTEKVQSIEWWRKEIEDCFAGRPHHPITKALHASCDRFPLPKKHFHDLLDGFAMDVTVNRYDTFQDLEQYCFRVASAVGLICIEIFEYENSFAREYAKNLGKALQITNILRDVVPDLQTDRIYIPREDMERFRVTESDLRGKENRNDVRDLIEFEWKRAGEYFERADAPRLGSDRRNFFPAEVMGSIYRLLWREIRNRDFDVFQKRVRISNLRKLGVLFRVYCMGRMPMPQDK